MKTDGFEVEGYRITSTKGPIASLKQSEDLAKELGFPHPTMTFPSNRVQIESPSIQLTFDALEAVQMISKTSPADIQVIYSEQTYWKDRKYSLLSKLVFLTFG